MRRRTSFVAAVTCMAFTTYVLWPRDAAAAGAQPSGQTAAPAQAAPSGPAAPSAQPAPGNSDAEMAQAKQHFETGRNAYNAGDYVTAIREFKAAEALRPSPILSYNIGLANEKLGKRRVAVKYYKRYLEQNPNAPNHAEVEGKVATLEQEIAAQPPVAATAQPGGTAPQPGAPPAEGQPPPPPAAQEQPSDMPPPDPNAGRVQPGYYDPYASTPPPGAPVAQKPKKKQSLWWIGLIVAGAVTITIAIVVVAVLAADTTPSTVYYDHPALTPSLSKYETPGIKNFTLFKF